MKKFLEYAMSLKTYCCMSFTGIMIMWAVLTQALNWDGIPLYLVVWQSLAISAAAALVSMTAFSNLVFKKMSYGGRLTFFAVTFLAVLSAFAVAFKWFPLDKIGYWLTFAAIFLVIFAAISVGFQVYFKVTGKKYNELLGEAQKK